MKSSRPLFYQCRVALIATGLVLLSGFAHAMATDNNVMVEEVANPSGKIEIQYEAEALAPYRQRRGKWSTILGLNASMLEPKKYFSQIDGRSFEDIFGSDKPISLGQMQLGAQYNFSLGSIGVSAEAGFGQVMNGRMLTIIKKGISATYTMNNLWPEPYIAPYLSGEIFSFDYKEDEGSTGTNSGTTAPGTSFTVGVLFQLNWLDPNSALDARNSSGLNNIFLDVFASQYNTSSSSTDPNFESDFNWGAGLKFEF